MPLIKWDESNNIAGLPGRKPDLAFPTAEEYDPPLLDTAASLLRQNSLVTNVAGMMTRPQFTREDGYNPVTDPSVSAENALRVIRSGSPAETRQILSEIAQEERDRNTIADSSNWATIPTAVALGVTDPLTLASMALPVAAPAVWGSRLARIGAGVAAQVGLDSASEVALHAAQHTRTGVDSAINVGAGALLTGALGALATRIPKTEFETMRKALGAELAQLPPQRSGSTVGAASAADFTTLDDLTIARGGRWAAKAFGWLSPLTRTMQSPFKSARALASRLAEVPYVLNMHTRGKATGPAVETDIRRIVTTRRLDVLKSFEDAFVRYSQNAGDGAMSTRQFGTEVSKALRRGDVSDVAEVSEVVKTARKLFDEDRKALQELGVLPEEFSLLGAESYFPRVYDFEAIVRGKSAFEKMLYGHFKSTPMLEMPDTEVLSALEGAPTSMARFFSEEFAGVPEARSVVLRSNTGQEVGRSVMMDRGDTLQLVRTQLAPGWKGRKHGQRMIVDSLTEADKLGKQLVSDSVVSSDQLRAFEALRRRGYTVEYFDDAEVQRVIKAGGEANAGSKPVVSKIVSPRRVLDGLNEQQKAARETLKTAKAAYTEAKGGSKAARLALGRAERRARRIEETIEELTSAEQTPKIAKVIERMRQRLMRVDEAVTSGKAKTMGAEVDQAAAKAVRRDEVVAMRALQRKIRSTKNAIAAEKRAVKQQAEIAAKAVPRHLEPAEIDTAVKETVDRILGTVRGMADVGNATSAHPLKHRTLNVPDELLEPWLVSDFSRVMDSYINTMAPQIEMRKAFGSTSLQSQLDELGDSYRAQLNSMPNDAAREKLRKSFEAAARDIGAMRDRILGTAGASRGIAHLKLVRAGKLIRTYNYMRLLGSQTMSSASDLGHIVSRYGLVKTGVALAKFSTNMNFNKMAREGARRVGTAADWVLDSRSRTLGEIGDEVSGTKLEQYANYAANKFSRWTLMSSWNSSMKAMTVALEQDAIIRALKRAPNRHETVKMAQHGIGEDSYEAIRGQIAKYADDSDGMWRARTELWDDKDAAKLVEDAMVKVSNIMVVSRGVGDLPLLMDHEIVKTLFQFKSFGMAATNRVLIPMAQGLARGDVASANGFSMMLALGAMTYMAKEYAAGREPDTSPDRIVAEALNWSGVLAYFPDVYDPVAGLLPAGNMTESGHWPRLSRFSNRTPVETAMGPTFGTSVDMYNMISGLTDNKGLSQKDLHRLRTIMPLQNVFYLRRLINAVEGETGEALGLQGSTRKTFADRVTETEAP